MTALSRTTHETRDDLMLGPCDFNDETVTADLTGTAASVTSASGETDDDSTKTLLVTVTDGSGQSWDGVEQTVTYPASCDTALEKAAAINDQCKGCHADVDTGHVVIATDISGPGVTIAIGEGTATTVWGDAVAGTGNPATWPKGTLLARNTSTKKMGAYSASGSNGLNDPVAVLPVAATWTASGDLALRVIRGGKLNQTKLSVLGSSSAVDTLVIDKLIKNSSITVQPVRDLGGTNS